MRPIIIDTDPGIDDVVAITTALFSEKLDVRLLSTVGGNVGIENTTKNTIDLVTFLGEDTPIAKGASEPLLGETRTASTVHGASGIGTYQFNVEGNKSLLTKVNAIEELHNRIINAHEPVTLVAIGPLTNIALLFKAFPEVKANIEQVVLMGGAVEGGNATPVAEFNIYADPHAAKIVFDSDVEVVMCGLDGTSKTSVSAADLEKVRHQGAVGEMMYEMLVHLKKGGGYTDEAIAIHDMCTIMYLTHPELFTTKRAKVNVATEGPAAGCTVTHFQEDGNVSVCVDTDTETFREEFLKVFAD
ncbi:ribonucleoside hydrolase RihC [Barrientosiimonas marina]|uniref:Nucleoside hydrolase n=1 Tax=Lentibacillus kimchii TaxID=1542911 RepID=A0ABW2URH4_9BACI